MKKLKMFLDKYFLTKLEKISPDLYRRITYDGYKKLSEYASLIKYKDMYFFYMVQLEISTYCNRKCHYCPNKDYETPKEFMSWEVFKKAIEDLKKINFTGIIHLTLYNEPLFDDRLVDFVKYIHVHLPKVTQLLISNGDLLNLEKAKELAEAGVDKFLITVHDKNPERNLERLKPVKEFLKEKMRLQTSNELYLENRGGTVKIKDEKRRVTYKTCQSIRSLTISKDGDIILCCQDYFKKYVMGNVMEKSILEIWNSYHDLRVKLLRDNIAELPICKKCLERE
ncbi:radical SAM superfamily [Brachyspira hyodysenteriae]|uniref:radical SAM/SPASM domain-containing protein n=1 Tax=Brachyspira hyodysenteriae TaxID=159 RepID=UPI00063DC704|nr:radical SAM/SPASM domain-containing protein [Brachyspira hyodysenteriae]KLI35204.1 radical SAM superfamily [Brachyspira hyodysenteriae]